MIPPIERPRYTPSRYMAAPGSLKIAKSFWPMPRMKIVALYAPPLKRRGAIELHVRHELRHAHLRFALHALRVPRRRTR